MWTDKKNGIFLSLKKLKYLINGNDNAVPIEGQTEKVSIFF